MHASINCFEQAWVLRFLGAALCKRNSNFAHPADRSQRRRGLQWSFAAGALAASAPLAAYASGEGEGTAPSEPSRNGGDGAPIDIDNMADTGAREVRLILRAGFVSGSRSRVCDVGRGNAA